MIALHGVPLMRLRGRTSCGRITTAIANGVEARRVIP